MASPSHTAPRESVAATYHPSDSMLPDLKPVIVFGDEITGEQLAQCATLFSENYGIWGVNAPQPLRSGKELSESFLPRFISYPSRWSYQDDTY